MAIRKSTRFPALVSSAAIIALALIPGAASAKTKPVDLQIETSTGVTLAAYTQYTGSTTAKADKRATCFGEDNPSSNKSYEIKGASPLSALIDAESHDDALSPLRLTDAFVDDGFGFGVCRIGDYSFSPVQLHLLVQRQRLRGEQHRAGPDLAQGRRARALVSDERLRVRLSQRARAEDARPRRDRRGFHGEGRPPSQ